MKNLRTVTLILLFIAAIATSAVWGKGRTPAQQKAAKNCDAKFDADLQRCLREHPELSTQDCSKAAAAGWHTCMASAGLAHEGTQPTQSPKGVVDHPSGKPTVNGASPTPKPLHHLNDLGAREKATLIKSPSTPTPQPSRHTGNGRRDGSGN